MTTAWQQKALFIAGTDTDVGKTQVTAGLALVLKERFANLGLWKPVQSGFAFGSPYTDSYRLWAGSAISVPEEHLTDGTFTLPLAPWMAARRTGMEISVDALLASGKRRIQSHDLLLAEGAGGVHVPLTGEYRIIDLIAALRMPTLIVARTGLGTVNHTLLTIESLQTRGIEVVGIILNSGPIDVDEQMIAENVEMIERFSNVSVLGVLPWLEAEDEALRDWQTWREHWSGIVQRSINVEKLMNAIQSANK